MGGRWQRVVPRSSEQAITTPDLMQPFAAQMPPPAS
jgi:hypothetical protein